MLLVNDHHCRAFSTVGREKVASGAHAVPDVDFRTPGDLHVDLHPTYNRSGSSARSGFSRTVTQSSLRIFFETDRTHATSHRLSLGASLTWQRWECVPAHHQHALMVVVETAQTIGSMCLPTAPALDLCTLDQSCRAECGWSSCAGMDLLSSSADAGPIEEEVHVAIDRSRHDVARGSKRLFAMFRTVLLMLPPFESPTSHRLNSCGKLSFALAVNSTHLPARRRVLEKFDVVLEYLRILSPTYRVLRVVRSNDPALCLWAHLIPAPQSDGV
jgi:hypothetical protein